MELAKIILTRIDARLVHGQVGSTWATALNVDTIVVIDDEALYNPFACKLMETIAIAASKKIRFYTVDKFVHTYFKTNSQQKLFLVVGSPTTAKRLVDLNIPITSINVGNMHYQKGKLPFNRKVYLDDNDIEAFNEMLDKDIEIYYQDVPGTLIEKFTHIDKEKLSVRIPKKQ